MDTSSYSEGLSQGPEGQTQNLCVWRKRRRRNGMAAPRNAVLQIRPAYLAVPLCWGTRQMCAHGSVLPRLSRWKQVEAGGGGEHRGVISRSAQSDWLGAWQGSKSWPLGCHLQELGGAPMVPAATASGIGKLSVAGRHGTKPQEYYLPSGCHVS